MTDEQRRRVHEITYSTEDREELAERIVALEDENARLRSMRDRWQENDANLREENAKLRDKNTLLAVAKRGIRALYDDLSEQYKELEVENAKLRGLVRDVYTLNWNGFDCTECPWFDECRTEGGCPWLGILHDHMRELGMLHAKE